MRKVVVNTTPLIALSHVGQLDILKKLYGEIMKPVLQKWWRKGCIFRRSCWKYV